jgi:hypothetical protein
MCKESLQAKCHVELIYNTTWNTFYFKGSLTKDFELLFLSQISFPHGPEYPIGTIANFLQKFLKKMSCRAYL